LNKHDRAFSSAAAFSMQHSRRRQPRVPANIWVTIEAANGRFDAMAANLGLGGAFIESTPSLSYGEEVVVHLPLPGVAKPLRLSAVVRWSSSTGFGVQFLEMGAKETHAISALVAAAS
jgi:hypothetical protein